MVQSARRDVGLAEALETGAAFVENCVVSTFEQYPEPLETQPPFFAIEVLAVIAPPRTFIGELVTGCDLRYSTIARIAAPATRPMIAAIPTWRRVNRFSVSLRSAIGDTPSLAVQLG
jgi:hypothetical protein